MSKELLKALTDVLDDLKTRKNLSEDDALNISDSVLVRAEKAIENYIAQPEHIPAIRNMVEQEPVAWMNDSGGCFLSDGNKYSENWKALYASPPKREPLSDEQIRRLDDDVSWFADSHTFSAVMRLIRSVEKAHGIGVGVDYE